jgi:hypothetical protein
MKTGLLYDTNALRRPHLQTRKIFHHTGGRFHFFSNDRVSKEFTQRHKEAKPLRFLFVSLCAFAPWRLCVKPSRGYDFFRLD